VTDVALKAYRLLGCRDYARVDLRVRSSGEPFILEVNPNPDIHLSSGFAGCLRCADRSHTGFVLQLVVNALSRAGAPRKSPSSAE
jgi:D-alanine-D-alanine ligase